MYTTLEPIVVLLFVAAAVPFYNNFTLFRNLLIVVGSFLVLMYPVLYYAIRQINMITYWGLRR